jgi:beta-mannosidase
MAGLRPHKEGMRRNMLTTWNVAHFDPGAGLSAGAAENETRGGKWLDVILPGDIHQTLFEHGIIGDPLGDTGEEECKWIADREWWWRNRFDAAPAAPGERLVLVFDGLDTFASIWLNGEEIGESSNMFVGLEIDVTDRLKPAGNLLAIRFDPVALRLADRTATAWPGVGTGTAETKRNLVRKAQFGWGWDWGPRLPTIGIWRPVELKRQHIAAITGLHFETLTITGGDAAIRVSLEVDAFGGTNGLSAQISLADPQGETVLSRAIPLSVDGGALSGRIDEHIRDAQLWWTADLGERPLYRITAELSRDGEVVASRALAVGIRTIALDTSPDPDEPGTDFFRFVLNGRPIFAKGTCWIPAHSLVGLLTEAHYRPLIEAARDGNMNMLRVWGGGIYEHDAFYDLCDELGALVWQDFMFACSPYPENYPDLVASIDAEAAWQVRRLRHHPSIALWCGNNENQFIQDFVNEAVGAKLPLEGTLYYDEIIPAQVATLDPTTPYWPGSPFGGPHANSMRSGDLHNWTVWHGLPPVPDDKSISKVDLSAEGVAYQRYAEDMGRFISEFGIQASPVLETLRRSVAADQLALKSPAMENRIKDNPKNKVDGMMEPVTGLPATIEDYVDFTQITQAEGLKYGIEHFRRRKPHCSGTLVWQHNDCWPGVSWSLIDFYGFAKAGFHYVRRAYAPLMASFKPLEDGAVELWITNDRTDAAKGEAIVELIDMVTGPVWEERVTFDVADNGSVAVWRADAPRIEASPRRVIRVRSAEGDFAANRYLFSPIKALERDTDAAPRFTVTAQGADRLVVEIEAPAYLFFVHLLVPSETAKFSDNYFDLAAGEARQIIIVDAVRPLRAEDVAVRSC